VRLAFFHQSQDENPHEIANDNEAKSGRKALQIHAAEVMLADRETFRHRD
jgi:hypothetical protein